MGENKKIGKYRTRNNIHTKTKRKRQKHKKMRNYYALTNKEEKRETEGG